VRDDSSKRPPSEAPRVSLVEASSEAADPASRHLDITNSLR
jgi:hypothetical protein